MYIKKIITILWLGIISAKVLLAQDVQTENMKVESGLATPVPGMKNSIQEDSVKMIYTGDDKKVFLPFFQSTTRNTAGDITVISPEEILQYDNVTTVSEVIAGRVPGIYSGTNIRGLGGAAVIIDGIPRSISSVNLSEVEQITILKDANAGMLYGVRSGKGVILITTKRGKANVNRINAIVETGFGTPISYPKYLGSADYMELYNEALINDGLPTLYDQDVIDGTRAGTNKYKYPDVDYYSSEFLKSFKPHTRVETEFTGGNETGQFYANLGWQRSGSLQNIGESSHDDRLNLRSNLDFRINDFINAHLDVLTLFNISTEPNIDYFSVATTLKPNYYPPLIDTNLLVGDPILRTAKIINGKYILGGSSLYPNTNVFGNLMIRGNNRVYNTTGMFNAGIDFDLGAILPGLTFKTYASFDFTSRFDETLNNTYAVYEPMWLASVDTAADGSPLDSLAVTKIGEDRTTGTQGLANTSLSRNFAFYGMLEYFKTFGTNNVLSAAILGYADRYNQTGIFQSDKHSHLGARINYVNNNRYIVNFNSALVSSPKLDPDNRVAFSPSLALGWIISEESFLNTNSMIDYLKLSVSAGIINSDMSLDRYYTYEDIWRNYDAYGQGDAARYTYTTNLNNAANPNLTFEKRKEFTVGAEMALFDNSLWIDANYFIERASDQIVLGGLSNTYPGILGSFNPAENFEEDKYSGVELGLAFRKTYNDFSFDIGPSLLFMKTKAIKRDEFYGYDYQYRAGKSAHAIFGLESLGFYTSDDFTGDVIDPTLPFPLFGVVRPGDLKYKDQNTDGFIDETDVVEIGNNLDKIVGGLTVKLKYKSLTLFTLATLRNGAEGIFGGSYYWVGQSGNNKYSEVVLDRWTPSTAATATYPRLSSQSNSNNFRTSTYWLEGLSTFSIDRMQLTLDLPESVASKLYTKNFSLYLKASNILRVAENKEKFDLNIGSEPRYRYFSVGLKALF